jgi:hypothetical protein
MSDIDKIRKFFKEADYSLEFSWTDKNKWASMDYEDMIIKINLPLFVASCFVHEFLHDQNPDASEETIKEKEDRVMNRLTVKEIKEIFAKFMKNAEWKV